MHAAATAGAARALARAAALAAAFAAVVACADRSNPTAAADPVAPDRAFARASSASGAEVVRGLFFPATFGGQPSDGLAVLVGFEVPVEEACADPNTPLLSPGRGQLVSTPSGGDHVSTFSHEARVLVFQYGAGIVTDFCQLVGAPVVATGTVAYSLHVSDPPGPGLVIHARVGGVVELEGGGQARLFGMWRQVVRPDGTVVFDVEPVRLTPL